LRYQEYYIIISWKLPAAKTFKEDIMAINPMMMMQLKTSWDNFVQNHPKFPKFWKAAYHNGITEGTVIEFKVKAPDGKELMSNLKLTREDIELIEHLKDFISL